MMIMMMMATSSRALYLVEAIREESSRGHARNDDDDDDDDEDDGDDNGGERIVFLTCRARGMNGRLVDADARASRRSYLASCRPDQRRSRRLPVLSRATF